MRPLSAAALGVLAAILGLSLAHIIATSVWLNGGGAPATPSTEDYGRLVYQELGQEREAHNATRAR